MKSVLSLLVVGAVMLSPAFAAEPVPVPVPEAAEAVALFPCVEYEDLNHIAPCAVPKIVMVKDPCACCDPCSCCAPKCGAVQICVPPCACEENVICKKDGEKVVYDYGKYRVEITSKKGYVKVDYDN